MSYLNNNYNPVIIPKIVQKYKKLLLNQDKERVSKSYYNGIFQNMIWWGETKKIFTILDPNKSY